MSNIIVEEAQVWCERTKLDLGSSLDGGLEGQVASTVLARLGSTYNTSTWTTTLTTPPVVKTIIAMFYAAWMYNKRYSDDNDDTNAYADKLMEMAEAMLVNLLDGTTEIPGVDPTVDSGAPAFYPTDASSAECPTWDDQSLGPAAFSMQTKF
jgi:hypothetical protein